MTNSDKIMENSSRNTSSTSVLNLTCPYASNSPRLSLQELLSHLNTQVNQVDFTIAHDDFDRSSLHLLKLVFPEWFERTPQSSDEPPSHIKLVQCKDGITNKLMKCKNAATGQTVLIRAYGKKSEVIIDRQAELMTFIALREDGLTPPLYCRFNNGFVYGYIPGVPIKPTQMSQTEFFPLIARKMAQWHRVDKLPHESGPRLFKTLRKFLKNVPDRYHRPAVQAKFEASIDLAHLEQELAHLERETENLSCPVVFCHNDLLSGNIIQNPEINDVAFIDYEYGSFNYRSFDIANHFCEYAGFDCDYSQYPKREFQRVWIREYLTTWNALGGLELPTDEEIEKAMQEVALFALAAHFFWGLWALIQAQFSDIAFDYMGYANLRFSEYEKRKSVVFKN